MGSAKSRGSMGFAFHFTGSLCYCVRNSLRGQVGNKALEGPLQWAKFKMVVTRMVAVEVVRSGWILDLAERRSQR